MPGPQGRTRMISALQCCLDCKRTCGGRTYANGGAPPGSAQVHFQRLQGGSWDDAQFANGAEAMSAVLELVRRHQARQPAPLPALLTAPAMHL